MLKSDAIGVRTEYHLYCPSAIHCTSHDEPG